MLRKSIQFVVFVFLIAILVSPVLAQEDSSLEDVYVLHQNHVVPFVFLQGADDTIRITYAEGELQVHLHVSQDIFFTTTYEFSESVESDYLRMTRGQARTFFEQMWLLAKPVEPTVIVSELTLERVAQILTGADAQVVNSTVPTSNCGILYVLIEGEQVWNTSTCVTESFSSFGDEWSIRSEDLTGFLEAMLTWTPPVE